MKYIFYSVMTVILFFIVALLVPEDAREKLCSTMYEQYEKELSNGTQHETSLETITQFCDAW